MLGICLRVLAGAQVFHAAGHALAVVEGAFGYAVEISFHRIPAVLMAAVARDKGGSHGLKRDILSAYADQNSGSSKLSLTA